LIPNANIQITSNIDCFGLLNKTEKTVNIIIEQNSTKSVIQIKTIEALLKIKLKKRRC